MSSPRRGAIALGIAVAACQTLDSEHAKHVTGDALEPYGEREECAKLAPGDRLEYAFSADAPVSFNIHYHDGAAVVEPIIRDNVTQDAGVFAPPLAHDYCLWWQAGPMNATLEYRLRIRRAGQ